MEVQIGNITLEEHTACWDHLGRYGPSSVTEPFWSVLTDERWRGNKMTAEEAIEEFYATGQGDLLRLEAWLRLTHLC